MLSQLRLGLSNLRGDIFAFHLNENPMCPLCFDAYESSIHFICECPVLRDPRAMLKSSLEMLIPEILDLNNKNLTKLCLFGSNDVSLEMDVSILKSTIAPVHTSIAPVHTVRDLGVMLDSNMTMSQHVLRVCQNCYFQIRLIRRLGKALSVESKLLLVHALVHSRLDYCNSVLVRLPRSLVQQLHSVLNSAARLIFGLKRFDHITPALMDLHWLPYPQRITYKLCMIMFKCLRGPAPAYLADYCTRTSLVSGRSASRSAAHGDIVVPSHRTDWGLISFAVAGPSSWNALPVGMRSSSFGLDSFAKHLKTHLFGLAYSRQGTHF